MCITSTINYLKNIVNRKENLGELLCCYIKTTNSGAGAIFLQKNDITTYSCLEFINSKCEKINHAIDFLPVMPVKYLSLEKEPIITSYKIDNCLIIPIIQIDVLGVVCLFNRPGGYVEEILEELSPCIALTQLHLTIEKQSLSVGGTSFSSLSKDLFLANISHEIRTPANGVIGYGQLLLQTELTSTQKHYLQSQNQCCIQLMQLINDVLDFSKLSSGKMNVNIECFRTKELVSILIDTLAQRIEEKKQKLKFVIGKEVPEFIILDKQKLIQIMVNLIANAYKFTDIGGYIEVSIHRLENNMLQLAVKDNGVGIKEEDQKKLFNSFEQVHTSACKTGTGLGLAICEKLTHLLNGYISVRSTIGLGSTFTAVVRYKPYEDYEKDVENDYKILKDKLVLIVDDNAVNRIILTDMLFELEMKPIVCASALEALRMVLANRYTFSIGLIDICMPGITGTELAKQIKQERPLFPMIALSSLDTFISTKEFDYKLDKPINKLQLYDAIYRIVSKKTSSDAYIGEDWDSNSSDSSSPAENFNTNAKILIAEDVLYNRNLLENMIEILGYNNFNSAENGKYTLEMITKSYEDEKPYDILLLDLRMPIVDGYEVIKELKHRKMKLPEIVVITASIMEEDKYKCKEMGVRYFINKPIDLGQLRDVLLHIIENHKLIEKLN